MTIDTEDLLNSIMQSIDKIDYIKPEDIPNIELYMDQVTTLMDNNLKSSLRNKSKDKVLTKTMINNYAKNNLLPPPYKKKYSKQHILLLIFIYYYKGVLSIGDIQSLLEPLKGELFESKEDLTLERVYKEIFALEKEQIENLKKDIQNKYDLSQTTFTDVEKEKQESLRLFSFISLLSFDVYVKKQMIENMIDSFFRNPEEK